MTLRCAPEDCRTANPSKQAAYREHCRAGSAGVAPGTRAAVSGAVPAFDAVPRARFTAKARRNAMAHRRSNPGRSAATRAGDALHVEIDGV
jgi:hypothetical protein